MKIDPIEREKRMVELLPVVEIVAKSLWRRPTPGMEYEELLSAGRMGLLNGVDGYRDDCGASLKTYVGLKIRGAMIDEIRRMVGRHSGSRRRQQFLVNQEVGDLDLSWIKDPSVSPEQRLLDLSVSSMLMSALSLLSEMQVRIMRQRYFDGNTFRQISRNLHRSEGRIHQLHRAAVVKMRRSLGEAA